MPAIDCLLSSYDYSLPPERIAQNPAVPRDSSRLLVVDSPTTQQHRRFAELTDFLKPGDLLVLNNTKVIPARLYAHKVAQTEEGEPVLGTKVEMLLLEEKGVNRWLTLVRPGRRLKPGAELCFGAIDDPQAFRAKVVDVDGPTGGRYVEFFPPEGETFWSCLDRVGEVPLPPYIQASNSDPEQYQTVYGEVLGAVAAPTAGLHFTPELLAKLTAMGVDQAFVTLHVGVGTFRPVESEDITQHKMHGEWVEVSAVTIAQIQATKARGGRVIAVGTTAVRSLEGLAWSSLQAAAGLPAELPAGLPAELPAGLPAELPACLPAELPAGLPAELPTGLPAELPAELPAPLTGASIAEPVGELASAPADAPASKPADGPSSEMTGEVTSEGTGEATDEAAAHPPLPAWKQLQPLSGKVNLYIYPGYQWQLVDGLITNFHLPKSSLLMLVSALIGRERLLALYQEAIEQEYRFYSFGDAMVILPEAVVA